MRPQEIRESTVRDIRQIFSLFITKKGTELHDLRFFRNKTVMAVRMRVLIDQISMFWQWDRSHCAHTHCVYNYLVWCSELIITDTIYSRDSQPVRRCISAGCEISWKCITKNWRLLSYNLSSAFTDFFRVTNTPMTLALNNTKSICCLQ
jgi:hypothetical protein